jgi:hypothetical protein
VLILVIMCTVCLLGLFAYKIHTIRVAYRERNLEEMHEDFMQEIGVFSQPAKLLREAFERFHMGDKRLHQPRGSVDSDASSFSARLSLDGFADGNELSKPTRARQAERRAREIRLAESFGVADFVQPANDGGVAEGAWVASNVANSEGNPLQPTALVRHSVHSSVPSTPRSARSRLAVRFNDAALFTVLGPATNFQGASDNNHEHKANQLCDKLERLSVGSDNSNDDGEESSADGSVVVHLQDDDPLDAPSFAPNEAPFPARDSLQADAAGIYSAPTLPSPPHAEHAVTAVAPSSGLPKNTGGAESTTRHFSHVASDITPSRLRHSPPGPRPDPGSEPESVCRVIEDNAPHHHSTKSNEKHQVLDEEGGAQLEIITVDEPSPSVSHPLSTTTPESARPASPLALASPMSHPLPLSPSSPRRASLIPISTTALPRASAVNLSSSPAITMHSISSALPSPKKQQDAQDDPNFPYLTLGFGPEMNASSPRAAKQTKQQRGPKGTFVFSSTTATTAPTDAALTTTSPASSIPLRVAQTDRQAPVTLVIEDQPFSSKPTSPSLPDASPTCRPLGSVQIKPQPLSRNDTAASPPKTALPSPLRSILRRGLSETELELRAMHAAKRDAALAKIQEHRDNLEAGPLLSSLRLGDLHPKLVSPPASTHTSPSALHGSNPSRSSSLPTIPLNTVAIAEEEE